MKSFADSVLVIEVLNADALKMVNADAIQELHAATSLDPVLSSLLSSHSSQSPNSHCFYFCILFVVNSVLVAMKQSGLSLSLPNSTLTSVISVG